MADRVGRLPRFRRFDRCLRSHIKVDMTNKLAKRQFSALMFAAAVLIALGATPAFGTTRYIAQTAGAFTGGSACNGQTAITPATFSGITNAAGDVDYICGTITFSANTTGISVKGSGSSGNPVTIKFDSGAILQSPQWPGDGTSGAIDIGSGSWITIDGNGGANGWTQGIIQATANGDSGATCLSGSCSLHGDSNGIEASSGASNIVIQGLTIQDMYVTRGNPNPGGGSCTYIYGTFSNWTIQNNNFHDMAWCINFQYSTGTSSNITISGNSIYNIDHGIAIGGYPANSNLTNINIIGNSIHDYSYWDTANDVWHHDGVHIWGYNDNNTDKISNITLADNRFGGCIGKNVTAHVFIEHNGGGDTNVVVHDNTFIDTCNGVVNDGMLAVEDTATTPKIYNNTFMGSGTTQTCVGFGDDSPTSITFVNNVVSGCNTLMYAPSPAAFASGGLHNNIYANCGPGGNCFDYHGNFTGAISSWQSSTGQDPSPSAYVSSANLGSDGSPQTGSAAIGAGANLSSLCGGSLTTLCQDITGAVRPTSGAWTAGAFNFGSTPAPAPPTNLNGTVQPK